jgi:hypothetical protein
MPLTKILNLQPSGEPSGKVVTIPNHATSTSWKRHKCLQKKKTHLVQIVTDFDWGHNNQLTGPMETNNCNRKIMPVTEEIRGQARMNVDKMTQQSLTLSWMRMLMMGISVMNTVW